MLSEGGVAGRTGGRRRSESRFVSAAAAFLAVTLGVLAGLGAEADQTEPPSAADPLADAAAPSPSTLPAAAGAAQDGVAQATGASALSAQEAASQEAASQEAASQEPTSPEPSAQEGAPTAEAGPPDWERFAAPAPIDIGERPILAIVIDDVTADPELFNWALRLGAPVTLSIFPSADGADALAERARAQGHEVLLHLPMEPRIGDAGTDAIKTDLSRTENAARLGRQLSAFSGYVGVNNHMGSAATANAETMGLVLDELKLRGLLFLDSRTSNESLGWTMARRKGVPAAVNQLFLDNERDPEAIAARLEEAAANARDFGASVAIGHAYPETLQALEAWIAIDGPHDVVLVPVSAVARYYQAR